MKPKSTLRFSLPFPLAAAIASLLAATSVHAQNLYWDANGTGSTAAVAHTGTWGISAFWSTDSTGANVGSPVLTAATSSANDLFFAAGTTGTAGTVTVSGTQSAHSITFEEGAVTFTGGTINLGSATAGSGLFFANVAGYNMNTPIILNSAATNISLTNRGNQGVTYGATGTIAGSSSGLQTITIGGTGSGLGGSTFSGIISNGLGGGTVALTVNALSGNILAAANTYTGATNILLGNLRIDNAATFANTSAINLSALGRLEVNVANQSLAKLSTAGGGTGVVERSFLRYSQAQGTGGTGPGTIFGTVELNHASVNPNYVLDFATGSTLTNVITTNYTSALTLSGNASIDSSTAAATYSNSTGGITASTAGAKTLTLVGTNTAANTISGAIGNGSGTIGILKSGAGNWTLSGTNTNTNTGNTRVDAGTLQFTNQVSLYNNGPLMRKYGNMLRGVDCPNAGPVNRKEIVDLRLLADHTAVHSDPFIWHPDEPLESAALQILNVIFSVPQVSVKLTEIPQAHREMIGFWMKYWRENRGVLLDGEFIPVSPAQNYPMISGHTSKKWISVIYQDMVSAPVNAEFREIDIINAKGAGDVVLRLDKAFGTAAVTVRDCRGKTVREEKKELTAGAHVFKVPASGLVEIRQRHAPDGNDGSNKKIITR